jgi:hypothetical protein
VWKLEDLVEGILAKVFEEKGQLEQVRGEAAEELNRTGDGLGAYLRF